MAFKLKGSAFYGHGNSSPISQKKETQSDKAKKVVASGTGKELKNFNVQDVSAVQEDRNKNKFVVSLKDEESYSGDTDNVITKGWKGSTDIDYNWADRDTFMVSNKYPKGLLIDETQMETGDAQKQSTEVPGWQSAQLEELKKEKAKKTKKKK